MLLAVNTKQLPTVVDVIAIMHTTVMKNTKDWSWVTYFTTIECLFWLGR